MSKGARSKTCGSMGSGWFATVKDHHRRRSSWRRRSGYGVPSRKSVRTKNSLLKNLVGEYDQFIINQSFLNGMGWW